MPMVPGHTHTHVPCQSQQHPLVRWWKSHKWCHQHYLAMPGGRRHGPIPHPQLSVPHQAPEVAPHCMETPTVPSAPSPSTHHLPQLALQVSLLHAQLLIGLDHLLQLLLPLLALLQLSGRHTRGCVEGTLGGQLAETPGSSPSLPPVPLTSCWNWLSCCCSDAFSLLSSEVSLAP